VTGAKGSRATVHGTSSTRTSRMAATQAASVRAASEQPAASGNGHSRTAC
jgi:hypothetical protein